MYTSRIRLSATKSSSFSRHPRTQSTSQVKALTKSFWTSKYDSTAGTRKSREQCSRFQTSLRTSEESIKFLFFEAHFLLGRSQIKSTQPLCSAICKVCLELFRYQVKTKSAVARMNRVGPKRQKLSTYHLFIFSTK